MIAHLDHPIQGWIYCTIWKSNVYLVSFIRSYWWPLEGMTWKSVAVCTCTGRRQIREKTMDFLQTVFSEDDRNRRFSVMLLLQLTLSATLSMFQSNITRPDAWTLICLTAVAQSLRSKMPHEKWNNMHFNYLNSCKICMWILEWAWGHKTSGYHGMKKS
jgi:hypothetical protein